MKPLVSIVIPIYNEELYLSKCIDCVINQSYDNLEIICVDDGSTDESCNILDRYKDKDPRIKVLKQKNMFAGVARNKGIDIANGKYLFFLDSDDYIDLYCIEKMVSIAEENNAEITICRYIRYDESTAQEISGDVLADDYIELPNVFSPDDYADWVFFVSGGWAWDKLYRTDFIKKNNLKFQEIRVANDGYFVNTSIVLAKVIAITKEALVTHRINIATSIESTRYKHWMCGVSMLDAVYEGLIKNNKYNKFQRGFIFFASAYLSWFLNTIKFEEEYLKLFNYIKNNEIEKLGLINNVGTFLCETEEKVLKDIREINENSAMGYLIYRLNQAYLETEQCHINIKNITELLEEKEKIISHKKWGIQEDFFPKDSRILIYGYGDVGRNIAAQMKHIDKIHLIGVIDRNISSDLADNIKVYKLNEIKSIDFDYVLVAIYNKKIYMDVRETLINNGIKKEKIYWFME